MKTLVCGGRDFRDRDALFAALDAVHEKHPIQILIHGAARGADSLAGQWADERGVLSAPVRALWEKHGRKAAGPIRNRGMLLLQPDGVIALPGGSGTADMITVAREAGVRVWIPFGAAHS